MSSVEERIIQHVVTTCQGVTSALGWGTDVREVQRQQGDAFQLSQYPGCIVIHDGTTEESKRLGIVDADLHLSIYFAHELAGADWPTDMGQFARDLKLALRADRQRGTHEGNPNARDTLIAATAISDSSIDGTEVTTGELRLRIPFAYSETDPARAH